MTNPLYLSPLHSCFLLFILKQGIIILYPYMQHKNNVDIVELSDQTAIRGEDPYIKVLVGVQAIVFLPAFKPFMDIGPLAATSRAELTVARRVLDAAKQQAVAAKGSSEIQKVVFVSRVVPWLLDNKSSSGGKVNFLSALLNERVDSDLYNGFRAVHADFEQQVRDSGFDYVVVRAPPVVEEAKEGARSELVILDRSGFAVSSSSASSSSSFAGSVGMLDLVSMEANDIRDIATTINIYGFYSLLLY